MIIMNIKKIISLTLVLCMVLSLCVACGNKKPTVEELRDSAKQALTTAESIDAKVTVTGSLNAKAEGVETTMSLDLMADVKGHLPSETAYTKLNLKANALGMNIDMIGEAYLVNDGEKKVIYSMSQMGEEKEPWEYETFESEDITESLLKDMPTIASEIDSFEMSENTIMFNEKECYLLYGEVAGFDNIMADEEDVEITEDDSIKSTSSLFADSMLNDINSLKDVKIQTYLYFDKETKTLVGIEMTLDDALKSLLIALGGEEDMGEVTITGDISIIINSLNQVKEITIPDAIKEVATEKEPDMFTDLEFDDEYVEEEPMAFGFCPECEMMSFVSVDMLVDGQLHCEDCDVYFEAEIVE